MTPIRIGSRPSPLALKQADMVKVQFQLLDPNLEIDIIPIATTGDKDREHPLSQIGGKGVFIKEIEQALLDHRIDIAVHSLKDMTTASAAELCLAGYLKTESNADAVILADGLTWDHLPSPCKIGTGSMRRKALLHYLNPAIQAVDIRGNVETRMQKVFSGELQGILLSEAGLIRLNKTGHISHRLAPETFCPAPGQGVIVMQCRTSDRDRVALCQRINDSGQQRLSEIELAFVAGVGLDCRDPLGVWADAKSDTIQLTVFWASGDFGRVIDRKIALPLDVSVREVQDIGDAFLKEIRHQS